MEPSSHLWARIVTIKGFEETSGFTQAVNRQLLSLGLGAETKIAIGPRRVLRVKGAVIVGFGIDIETEDLGASLLLQEQGIGGRRHFGCGLFTASTKKARTNTEIEGEVSHD